MLTTEEIKLFREDGITFEQIESINRGIKNIEEGKTISLEESKRRFLYYRQSITEEEFSLNKKAKICIK